MERIIEFFEKIPMTVVSGIFLVLSFALPRLGIDLPIDPAWVSVTVSGLPLLYSAVRKLIKNRGISRISSALLISIAMIAAIAIGDLFAAGEVAFIMALGEILEELTTDRAKKGLRKLIALAPVQGRRICESGEEIIPAEEIRVGDIIRILPGEAVPVDGVIIGGESSIDQSVVTGESLPVDKGVGDTVYCGTVNRFGAIDIRATGVGEESSLSRLIRMVREAEEKKAPMARVADKAASWLVPAALLIAIVTLIVFRDITRAVTVLVVFCPCALVLATPTAIMAAIGQATKKGVIIKSGEALEKMGRVDIIAFDKTGTLTYGRLAVCDVIPFDDKISADELLSLAASVEARSEHPLAQAITSLARLRNIAVLESGEFRMSVGRGVCAEIEGERVICGSEGYIEECGIVLGGAVKERLDKLRREGKASVLVARGEAVIGAVALSDEIRPEAEEVVRHLEKMNMRAVLLTGDNRLAAQYFADRVGVTDVRAELLPEEKVSGIDALQSAGHTVCMIGDGVNDAPALGRACIGVAMGSIGSDIAVEAADIALMNDDISNIPYLKRLSVATLRTIKLSITLSMLINIAAVVLSVAGLLGPTTGALVHNAGSCFVVLISALLYDRKFK